MHAILSYNLLIIDQLQIQSSNMPQFTIIVIVSLLFVAAICLEQHHADRSSQFQAWKVKYGARFDNEMEKTYRQMTFLSNVAKIMLHNSNHSRTYDMGTNKFSALTSEEFTSIYYNPISSRDKKNIDTAEEPYTPGKDINWTSKGAVTPVKNQGHCGSCWAFSATGGLQALSKLEDGELQSFSEQMLIDCSAYGCDGGYVDLAYQFVIENGIVTESEYSYVASRQPCRINHGPFKIREYKKIGNCQDLANQIQSRPVSVPVNIENWDKYESGIFSDCGTIHGHAALLTGLKDGNWVVKNSWGIGWGENGYIRLAKGNTCNICSQASYPVK